MVVFYGISTIEDYLIPNLLYIYILDIYDLAWLGFMSYQPNKSSLYIHTKYIWIFVVVFYGISTIEYYLIPNTLYTYIYQTYMIWYG